MFYIRHHKKMPTDMSNNFFTTLFKTCSNSRIFKFIQSTWTNIRLLQRQRKHTPCFRIFTREQAEELGRLAELGKISAGMFHDLINPLTAVSLSVEQLIKRNESQKPDAEMQSAIRTALDATRRMDRCLADIKHKIAYESGPLWFNAAQELEQSVAMCSLHASQSGVSLVTRIPEPLTLYGSPIKFSQIVINLVTNAIDASQETPGLSAETVTIGLIHQNEAVYLSVHDRGIGIAPEICEYIWKPFFTSKRFGTGLGLATTRTIVEQYFNGTISVTCSEDSGTTFTVKIPHSQN
jgi:signal transduction histidine kinase